MGVFHHHHRRHHHDLANLFKLMVLLYWFPIVVGLAMVGYTFIGLLALVKLVPSDKPWKGDTPAVMARKFSSWLEKVGQPFTFGPRRRHVRYHHTTHVTVTVAK